MTVVHSVAKTERCKVTNLTALSIDVSHFMIQLLFSSLGIKICQTIK